jgi:CDP-4-dehydro-6-deoxyglucose reductase, E3
MDRYISLSRAARLVGSTRTEIQKKIQEGELMTFEGELKLAELLRAYPETQLEDNTMIEKVERLMQDAVNKVPHDDGLPSAYTLHRRLKALSEELAQANADLCRYRAIIDKMNEKMSAAEATDAGIEHIHAWFQRALNDPDICSDYPRDLIARNHLLSLIAAHVRILPSGHDYFVDGADSLLEGGLKSGLALDYGCSNGICGKCRARIVSGEVRQIKAFDYVLTEEEKEAGHILTCCYSPVTDVILESAEAHGAGDVPVQYIDTKVKGIKPLNDHVTLLQLRPPRTRRLRFLAGQYATLSNKEMKKSNYSIASCPCDDMNIQFHIDMREDTPLSRLLRENGSISDLRLEGPHGEFIIKEDSEHSDLFIAWGGGFAPIKSLVEQAMALDKAEDIHLYWFAPEGGHYLNNLCRAWDDALDNLFYHPVTIEQDNILNPEVFADIGSALRDYDIYISAPDPIITDLTSYFERNGVPEEQIRSEQIIQG